jgi:NAD(P)-dependent dehydrogenase (short-subunit alcohol dehydrogenase family)
MPTWRESIDVNLTGAFHTAKATVPIMIAQGRGGAVVFTGSVAGLRGLPFLGAYVAAKHGVVGLAKTLANELAEHRIRVNTVIPHGVSTDLTVAELFALMESAPHQQMLFAPSLPDGVSTVDDIAAAVAWLASDEARHVTGIQLLVDPRPHQPLIAQVRVLTAARS